MDNLVVAFQVLKEHKFFCKNSKCEIWLRSVAFLVTLCEVWV